MAWQLQYLLDGEELSFSVPEGEIAIGRKDYCELQLLAEGVSKEHAFLRRKGKRLEIRDAGSRNGTLVNGEPVDRQRLAPGDVLQIGSIALTLERRRDRRTRLLRPGEAESAPPIPAAVPAEGKSRAKKNRPPAEAEAPEPARPAEAGPRPRAQLQIALGGAVETVSFEAGERVSLGSKADNTVVLSGDGVSRNHAELVYEDGWLLRDLGSRNGIYVRAGGLPEKVAEKALADKDEIQIGTVRLRFLELKPRVDWAGKLKADPRLRVALAAVVVAVLALLIFMPGAAPPPRPPRPRRAYKARLAEAAGPLIAGRYEAAREAFARLARAEPERVAPGLLRKIAARWPDQSNPIIFDWKGAYVELEELKGGAEELPDALVNWIEGELVRVGRNRDAFEALRLGQETYERGDKAAAAGRRPEALADYQKAYELFSAVASDSAFAERGREQAALARRTIYQHYLRRADEQADAEQPRWQAALELYQIARGYTDDPQALDELRRRVKECVLNAEDQVAFEAAERIVRARRSKDYETALELLRKVKQGSRLYEDARATIAFIKADQTVREATEAYNRGSGERALRLLKEVLKVESLSKEARRGVAESYERWNRVILTYEAAKTSYLQGREGYKRAESLLEQVVGFEQNPSNAYRSKSQQLIGDIRVATLGADLKVLEQGIKALEDERLGEAILYFDALRRSSTAPKDAPDRVREAVEKNAAAKGWFREATQDILQKKAIRRYERASDIYYLLKEYLPKDNPTREAAERYFKQIEAEIRRELENSRG